MTRLMPAAAITTGTMLRLPEGDIEVEHVYNATPQAGKLVLRDTAGGIHHFGGAQKVEVVSFP